MIANLPKVVDKMQHAEMIRLADRELLGQPLVISALPY
ncbi:MAG: hypothetical protein JWN69_2242 [Alphaproteobacteria bacterium]|jgi:hypothetical protein|nr:hypothetical protein [Alphaproteobacteria bacterium]